MENLRRYDVYNFIGLHAKDLCLGEPADTISSEIFPSSWQGGVPSLGLLRYAVWSRAIARFCTVAEPKLTPAIWYPHNIPEHDDPTPITLLPPEIGTEECPPGAMHVFYPSVVSALRGCNLILPQFKITHAGKGKLNVTFQTHTPRVLVAIEEPSSPFTRVESSTIIILPNTPTTVGILHENQPLPIFSLYTAYLTLENRLPNARGPLRIFAMRIEDPLLNLLDPQPTK